MPVLVTYKFDKDPINNERPSYEKFFQYSRACNTEVNDPIQLEFELIWDFIPVLDTCKFGEDPIKNDWEKVETPFSPLEVNGSFWLPRKP